MNIPRVARAMMLAAALLLAPDCLAAAPARDEQWERTIDKTYPAAKLRAISVKANVGRIEVRGGAGEQVVLHVKLRQKESFFLFRSGDPGKAEVAAETSGDTLRLNVRVDGDRDDLEEDWSLQIPARLAVRLYLNVGEMKVEDVAGGVDLYVNVGEVEVNLPRGDITAKVNVGEIRVSSAASACGAVSIRTNIGDARVRSTDPRVRDRVRGGLWNRISFQGSGKDRIDLKVNIGDASLTLRGST